MEAERTRLVLERQPDGSYRLLDEHRRPIEGQMILTQHTDHTREPWITVSIRADAVDVA